MQEFVKIIINYDVLHYYKKMKRKEKQLSYKSRTKN